MVFEGFDVLQDGHRLTKRGIEGRKAGRPVFKVATFSIRFYIFETRICAKCDHLNGARSRCSWFYCASFVRQNDPNSCHQWNHYLWYAICCIPVSELYCCACHSGWVNTFIDLPAFTIWLCHCQEEALVPLGFATAACTNRRRYLAHSRLSSELQHIASTCFCVI